MSIYVFNGYIYKFVKNATWFGLKVFAGIEYVGETVVSVLGLDDSHYQEMLDNMTEREMEVAQQVHEEREKEYSDYQRHLELTEDSIENPSGSGTYSAEEDTNRAFIDNSSTHPVGNKGPNDNAYASLQHLTAHEADEEARVELVDISLTVPENGEPLVTAATQNTQANQPPLSASMEETAVVKQ